MALGLLQARLEARGVPATVRSAGLLTHGRPPSDHGVTAMRTRGIDIAGHRSQQLSPELLGGVDLVLGMERRHVREVAVLDARAFAKAFTLPELARRARTIGPRRPDEPVADWIARAGAGRRPTDLLASDPADEVADPIGRPLRDYERTARELEELVDVVVDHLHPH